MCFSPLPFRWLFPQLAALAVALLTQTEALCRNADMQQGFTFLASLALRLPALPAPLSGGVSPASAAAAAHMACAWLQPAAVLLAFAAIGAYMYSAELSQRRTFLLHAQRSSPGEPAVAGIRPAPLATSQESSHHFESSSSPGDRCAACLSLLGQCRLHATATPCLGSGSATPAADDSTLPATPAAVPL